MFTSRGTRLFLRRGDFGQPLAIRVTEHCDTCGAGMEETDIVRIEITRAMDLLVMREISWSELTTTDGLLNLTIAESESALLRVGLYTWRVVLIREGEVLNTLMQSTLEVLP